MDSSKNPYGGVMQALRLFSPQNMQTLRTLMAAAGSGSPGGSTAASGSANLPAAAASGNADFPAAGGSLAASDGPVAASAYADGPAPSLGSVEPAPAPVLFTHDETESRWRREERVEMLKDFCREGYPMAQKYGHFLIGTHGEENYLAVPGRFLLMEQPAGGATGFTLWYPLAGGEALYDQLETMDEALAERVYGYWIARLDAKTLEISEV